MINAIAIDDEPIALDVLKAHAAKIPFVNLLAVFTSATEALAHLQTQPVDLVFLDIQMPDITGIDFAALLPPTTQVVFTTAYQQYAVQGFEIAATDYLLKPINFARLTQACNRVSKKIAGMDIQYGAANILFVKDGYNLVKINVDKITYIKAADNYLSIYEGEKRTLARMTFAELLQKLPAAQFLRIHKSYVVALAKIEKVERSGLLVNGMKIPVSGKFRDDLMKRLNLAF